MTTYGQASHSHHTTQPKLTQSLGNRCITTPFALLWCSAILKDMSSAVAAQACCIVAPEKLPDRFLASGILCSDPSLPLSQQVVLAYVFEVARPWLPSSHLLPSLQDVLNQEYEKIHIKHDLDAQFEELLKAVNNQLNSVSEAGETDWIGNLSGLIVLVGHHELHFSQTGSCPAYLLQNNRIRQITDDLSGEGEPHH